MTRAPGSKAALGLCAALCAGTGTGLLAPWVASAPQTSAAAALMLMTGALVWIARRRISAAATPQAELSARLGGVVVGVVLGVAIALPGLLTSVGGRTSKLEAYGLSTGRHLEVLAVACIALLAFVGGEAVVRRATPISENEPHTGYAGRYIGLLAIWGLSLVVASTESRGELFSERGLVEGQGIVTLMRWALPLAIAYAVLSRSFGLRWVTYLNLALLALMITWGTRSPLLLIGLAAAVRAAPLLTTATIRARTILVAGIGTYFLLALTLALPAWRADVVASPERASLITSYRESLVAPTLDLSSAGLDSYDGLSLALQVDPNSVDASIHDLSKSVTGFVPHQLWPEKPKWLGAEVARTYLGWDRSGMFLSGVGYLYLIAWGLPGVVLGFAVLGVASAVILRVVGPISFASVLWLYFLARFVMGGDAFDVFHVLGLAALYSAVAGAQRAMHRRSNLPKAALAES